jgi:SAM-dependent methyltransferase
LTVKKLEEWSTRRKSEVVLLSVPHKHQGPAALLTEHFHLLIPENLEGPVLDLACGDGHNGLFLAVKGLNVVLADVSGEALRRAADLAERSGAKVHLWQVDFETEGGDPLKHKSFGAILVFRYLHRPLFPAIKQAIRHGGILIYEIPGSDQAIILIFNEYRPNNGCFEALKGHFQG